MEYEGKSGTFLIYCYSEYKNTWKIEKLPFDGTIIEVSEQEKNRFIKNNKLVPKEYLHESV